MSGLVQEKVAKKDKRPVVIRYLTKKLFNPKTRDDAVAQAAWESESPSLLALVAALDNLPGAEAQHSGLKNAADVAIKHAEDGDYKAAMSTLKAANVKKLAADGRKAAGLLGEQVAKNAPDVWKRYDRLRNAIDKAQDILPAMRVTEFLARLDKIVAPFATRNGSKGEISKATTAIANLDTEFSDTSKAGEKARKVLNPTFQEVTKTLGALSSALLPATFSKLEEQRKQIATLIDEREYIGAQAPLKNLKKEVNKVAPTSSFLEYIAVVKDVSAAEKSLRELPGAEEQLKEITKTHTEANAAANDGDYVEALRIIKSANIDEILQRGQHASDARHAEADENYPDLTKKAAQLRATIVRTNASGVSLAPAVRADLLQQLADAVAPLYQKVADATGVGARIAHVEAAVKDESATALRARTAHEASLKAFRVDLAKSHDAGLIAEDDYDKLRAEPDKITSTIDQGNYDVAGQKLDDLVDHLAAAKQRASALKREVAEAQLSFKSMQSRTEKLTDAIKGLPLPSALPTPEALEDRITALALKADIGLLDDLGAFVKDVAACRSDLEQLEACAKAGQKEDMKGVRAAADGKVKNAQKLASEALGELQQMSDKTPKVDGLAGPSTMVTQFQTRLDTIVTEWRETLAATLEVANLDPAATVNSIDSLRGEIVALLKDPASVEASNLDDMRARALAQITKEASAVRVDIEKLATLNIIKSDALSRSVDGTVALAKSSLANYDAADIPKEIEDYLEFLKDDRERAQTEFESLSKQATKDQEVIQGLIDDAGEKLVAFATWIEKRPKIVRGPADIRGASQEANYGEMRDSFRQRLDEATALSRVSSAGVLRLATADVEKLRVDIDWALKSARAERGKGSTGSITMAGFLNTIKSHKAHLADKRVTTYCAKSTADLTAELLQLESGIKAMSMDHGNERLAEFGRELQTLDSNVDTAESNFLAFDRTLTARVARVGQKDGLLGKFPALQSKLLAKLEACRTMAKQEGNLATAKKEFEQIGTEIDACLADKGKSMPKKETDAAAEKQEAEKQEALFKARCDAYEKRAEPLSAKNKKEVAELIATARKIYSKTKDAQSANQQLRSAVQRLEYFEKYPQGVAVSKNADLTKVAQDWAKAAGALRAALQNVVKKVENFTDAEAPQAVKDTVSKQVGEVSLLLSPIAFNAFAGELQATDMSLVKKRLGQREQGLRCVGKVIAVLESDPRLIALSENPFEAAVRTEIIATRLAALDMQQTLLGCI